MLPVNATAAFAAMSVQNYPQLKKESKGEKEGGKETGRM